VIFPDFTRIDRVEGPNRFKRNELINEALRTGQGGFSLYEFHWEYPIERFGVRKNLISVITQDKGKVPLFDWCEENNIIVFATVADLR